MSSKSAFGFQKSLFGRSSWNPFHKVTFSLLLISRGHSLLLQSPSKKDGFSEGWTPLVSGGGSTNAFVKVMCQNHATFSGDTHYFDTKPNGSWKPLKSKRLVLGVQLESTNVQFIPRKISTKS